MLRRCVFRHLCTTLSHPAIIRALCRWFPIAGLYTRAAFSYLNMLEPLKCDRIYLINRGLEGGGWKSHWWGADNSVSNHSESREINDKFVLWASLRDVLILHRFTSNIYVCRQLFHYHRACLIFLSCARGPPHYRWLSAPDLKAPFCHRLSSFPQLCPRTSGHTEHTTESAARQGDEEMKRRGSGQGEEEEEEEAVCTHRGRGASQRGPPCLSPISPAEGFDSPDCLQYWDTQ